jgi:hypothetical protein
MREVGRGNKHRINKTTAEKISVIHEFSNSRCSVAQGVAGPPMLFFMWVADGSHCGVRNSHQVAQMLAPHHSSTYDADAQF